MDINEIYKSVEQYLFIFTKENKDKIIFDGIDLSLVDDMDKNELTNKMLTNIGDYFVDELSNGKIAFYLRKYINSYGIQKLRAEDFEFYGNIISMFGYECTFDDMGLLYSMKEVKEYIDKKHKDKSYLVEQLDDYISTLNEEEEEEEVEEEKSMLIPGYTKDFDSTDARRLYNKDVEKYREILTTEEVTELFRRYREENDKDAYDKLVLHNQGLVQKIAHSSKYIGRGMDVCELYSEGNLGLMKAIEKFDPSKGFRFSTYAIWWIRQTISRAVFDQLSTIRIPVHAAEKYFTITRATNAYVTEYGEEPTVEDLSQLTGFTVAQINNILSTNPRMVSLNKPVDTDTDSDSEFGDFIIDEEDELPDEIVLKEDTLRIFDEAISRLRKDDSYNSIRRERVFRLRLGSQFYNEDVLQFLKAKNVPFKDKYTLGEVGKMYGVTRERIRQIEEKARRDVKRSFVRDGDVLTLKKQLGKSNN